MDPSKSWFPSPCRGKERGSSQEPVRLTSGLGEGWEGKTEQPRSGITPPLWLLLPHYTAGSGCPALREGWDCLMLKASCPGDWGQHGHQGCSTITGLAVPFSLHVAFSQLLDWPTSCALTMMRNGLCFPCSLCQLL